MRHRHTEKIKQWVRPWFFRTFHQNRPSYLCPICGYEGPFKDKLVSKKDRLVRKSSKCPGCAATERHRMMHLVLRDLFANWDTTGKSLLHIAPEECLKEELRGRFRIYETADLYRSDVDHREDIQRMSFPDGSYDCVILSRVLISPPDLEACISECRRVLRPGGVFVVAEYYPREKTAEYGEMRGDRSRELGVDVFDLYRRYFRVVDLYDSERFDPRHQLINLTWRDGALVDDYPDQVRAPGRGLKDVVAVCWA